MSVSVPNPASAKRPISRFRQVLPHLIILPSIALLLSAVMAWANVGFGDAFLGRWARGFVTSLVVLPVVLSSLGVVESVVNRVFGAAPKLARKFIVAFSTAMLIESVLALFVTLTSGHAGHSFGAAWWLAFSRSLPLGVAIGLFMTFYMKPKLDQMSRAAQAAA